MGLGYETYPVTESLLGSEILHLLTHVSHKVVLVARDILDVEVVNHDWERSALDFSSTFRPTLCQLKYQARRHVSIEPDLKDVRKYIPVSVDRRPSLSRCSCYGIQSPKLREPVHTPRQYQETHPR